MVEVVVVEVVVVDTVTEAGVDTETGAPRLDVSTAPMDVVTNPVDAIGEMINSGSGEQERPSQADTRRTTRSRIVPR